MAASAPSVGLPVELLLHIIDWVLPPNPDALIPASHISTRTLLSLTQVSRTTYKQASRLLRERCVYVESNGRLADVLLCLPRLVPTLPPALSLRHITSLYLAPFGCSLEDQQTATGVRDLLCEVCGTLRRLVVQMPFSSIDPLDDRLQVRRTLRDGFEHLHQMEEFVSLEEYPDLSVADAHTDVWRLWPDLRRLVLFNVPMESHWLWWDIATLPKLQHVILARPMRLPAANIKDEYFHKLPRGDARLSREIKVVLIDTPAQLGRVQTTRWGEIDPEDRMSVEACELPMELYGHEKPHQAVTDWVKGGALDATIWGWKGQKMG